MTTAEQYDAFVLKNYNRAALTLTGGRGTEVWDDAGKRYLDFTSGIAVNTLGHNHPAWVAAVCRQAASLAHTSNIFRTAGQGELAGRLVHYAGPGRVFFCNSGAEANEALIKLARLHGVARSGGTEGKRIKIISAQQAFHGRTFGAMSATPQEKIQKGFAPLVPGFAHGQLNDLPSFARLIDDQTAAILIEPVQGEGGVRVCKPEFLIGLRALCDQHGLLLLLDEVQCGIGRTGRFFAFEQAGITPDAVAMAKGLGGGFPIGAMWVATAAADLFKPGSHGSTFGGGPLACSAALAVLEVLERDNLMGKVRELSGPWLESLHALRRDFPAQLTEVRGCGYLVGLQLASDPVPYVAALRERGLLAPAAGGNVVRLLPPLTVSAEELARATEAVRAVLAAKA
jgi:acetylornithine aminotransferase/acetylornithine/N-succinyldiaminopimelate aminotransferase